MLKLYKPFGGKDILDIGEYVGGKPLRGILGVITSLYLMFIISVVLREFSEDMKIISLPVTPISLVSLFFLVGMIAGAYMGIEAIVRMSAVVVPLIIVAILIIGIGVSQYNDFSNLMPVLGAGPYEVFVKGSLRVSIYSGIFILFLLASYLKTERKVKQAGFTGLVISAVFLFLSTLQYLLVYPYKSALEYFVPIYQLSRIISYGRFFQRIESIFLIVWVAAALTYLSTGFFFIVHQFKKGFGLSFYKPLIFPFAVIVLTLSLLPPNLMSAIELETRYFRTMAWVVAFGIIIFILAAARLKLKRQEGSKSK
jgi:spore germination protein (amino acid permease)